MMIQLCIRLITYASSEAKDCRLLLVKSDMMLNISLWETLRTVIWIRANSCLEVILPEPNPSSSSLILIFIDRAFIKKPVALRSLTCQATAAVLLSGFSFFFFHQWRSKSIKTLRGLSWSGAMFPSRLFPGASQLMSYLPTRRPLPLPSVRLPCQSGIHGCFVRQIELRLENGIDPGDSFSWDSALSWKFTHQIMKCITAASSRGLIPCQEAKMDYIAAAGAEIIEEGREICLTKSKRIVANETIDKWACQRGWTCLTIQPLQSSVTFITLRPNEFWARLLL